MNISGAPDEGWVWHKSGVGHRGVVVGASLGFTHCMAGLKITTVIASKSKLTHLSAAPPPSAPLHHSGPT